MMKKNNHIKKYLDFYCDNNIPFAVLLKGKWWCWKTYFIKEYIKEKDQFIHISLYGLSKCSDIDEKIFFNLLMISLKKWKFSINIENDWIKKFLNFCNKWKSKIQKASIFSANFLSKRYKIEKKDLYSFFNDFGNKIIIFDDLERCNIKMGQLLGYLTHFVEFQNQKIILIADEEKILEDEKKGQEYIEKKEKLIGKEFVINANPERAINLFVWKIKEESLKEKSEIIKEILLKIFYRSKYDNLRIIEQALFSFDYFFQNCQINKIANYTDVFYKMCYEFIVIFVEYKKGEIKNEDFNNSVVFFKDLIGEKKDAPHLLDKYKDRTMFSYWLGCFNFQILGKIFQGESLTKIEINKLKNKISSLIVANKESWMKLWDYKEYSDDDFFVNLKEVEEKWQNKEYDNFFVVFHIFGIFLNLSINKLIYKAKGEILKEAKEYIELLISSNNFPLELCTRSGGNNHFWWVGKGSFWFGYYEQDSPEWKELLEFIAEKIEDLKVTFIKEKIKNEFIPILKGEKEYKWGLDSFINFDFSAGKAYFQYLDESQIAEILVKNKNNYYFKKAVTERYSTEKDRINNIELEKPFLKKLKKELERRIEEIENKFDERKTPKSVALQNFIDEVIEPSIDNLLNCKTNF